MRQTKIHRWSVGSVTAIVLIATGAAAHADDDGIVIGNPDAAAPIVCAAPEGTAVARVSIDNIRYIEGNLRVQLYGSDPDDYLEKGKKLLRYEEPVLFDMQTVCITLPSEGVFAIVAMLDRNANGKADFFTEGFGFSGNPELNLGPPDHEETAFEARFGVNEVNITLKYLLGVDAEKAKKRRKLRRR